MASVSTDVLLVGSGAMSSTLGSLLKQLDPSLNMMMVEQLDSVAQESTNAWMNAGTGHAAYCELNYTPQQADGSITLDNAYSINEKFKISLQFWSYLVEQEALPAPENFIKPVPHISFVWGDENVEFLRNRYQHLSSSHLFTGMEFSDDPVVLKEWMPLVMNGRDTAQKMAGTRVNHGSDVNFAAVSRGMTRNLQSSDNFKLLLSHSVKKLKQDSCKKWTVSIRDEKTGTVSTIKAGFVFLGAGGAAIKLLQKSKISESKLYGGFPVSGQWLVCNKAEIVKQHKAKVYGKASIGTPPMSIPHLDLRVVDGKEALLFGPFAGFTTRFMKHGSVFDLFSSINFNNIRAMIKVGFDNQDLLRYLISEVLQTRQSRIKSLREYYPEVDINDWFLAGAGQRVQIIKKCPDNVGKLEFGTEVVTAADHSLATLLGASPGASVSVDAMIQVIEKCFAVQLATEQWQQKIKQMIPSYGESLINNKELSEKIHEYTLSTLKLNAL